MKISKPLLLFATCYGAIPVASAEFEKWTDVQGRVAEMDIVSTRGEGAAMEVEFRLRSGKQTTIQLSKLDAAGRLKIASWQKLQPRFTARFDLIETDKDLGPRPDPSKKPQKRGQPGNEHQPYLSFGFTVSGENIVGIDPQRPVVKMVKVGDKRSFKWQDMLAFRAQDGTEVRFGIKGYGDYRVEDFDSAEFTGSVEVLTSPGPEFADYSLKLPTKAGEQVSEKAGIHTVVAEWTEAADPFSPAEPKMIWVDTKGIRPLEIIETSVVVDGKALGQRVPIAHAGKAVIVRVKYWDKLQATTVPLVKTAENRGSAGSGGRSGF